MRPFAAVLCAAVLHGVLFCTTAFGQELTMEDIAHELDVLKARVNTLERELSAKDQKIETLKAQMKEAVKEPNSVEKKEKWSDRIELSGVVEVDYGSEKRKANDYDTGNTTRSRDEDITFSTVELHADAKINKYTTGHVVFLYEEDEDEDRIRIDEGTIRFGGIEETRHLYFQAGKYYPHFGELNTWFISDPLTCQIFEIQETAAEAGYTGKWFSSGVGIFHGDVQKSGDDESRIKGLFADANVHNPKGTLGGLSLLAGASYLNNVADTDTLRHEVSQFRNDVPGVALYLVAEYHKFSFGAEYITALDDFHAGEMAYALNRNGTAVETRPCAWNLELAYRPLDPLRFAVKYEGSEDLFGLFPKRQYGLAVSYDLLACTTLSAEYLHGDYDEGNRNESGQEEGSRDGLSLQLAVEF